MSLGRFLKPIFLASYFLGLFPKSVLAQNLLAGPGPAPLSFLNVIFGSIIRLAIPAAALVFFAMMIVAGFRFLLSGGDPKAIASSRDTLTYAVIGAILMVAAILILVLIEQVTGAQITFFDIKFPEVPQLP